MPHLVLLGDSIFDNAQYTGGGPDVASHVRKQLPSGWGVSLLAVDGSTTANIPDQVQRLPREATHLVLSVGGNNALAEASRLGISFFGLPNVPTSKALDSLADISGDFEDQYRSAIDACLRPRLPLGVCTIYNGWFPVIDLRLICTDAKDYASPIEPSSMGGEKIAKVIAALVAGRDEQLGATRILV